MFSVNKLKLLRGDLDFLLQQVSIGVDYSQLTNALDPSGLREVAGTNNNLVGSTAGQPVPFTSGPNADWGAADNPFLRLAPVAYNPTGPDAGYIYGSDFDGDGSTVNVRDASPRTVSNLVSNMLISGDYANPAALEAATNGQAGATFNGLTFDRNGSAPGGTEDVAFVANAGVLGGGRYNSWFVAFGQFFDHGLDFVQKGVNGKITIPISPSDPLYVPPTLPDGTANPSYIPGVSNKMVVDRANLANPASDFDVNGVLKAGVTPIYNNNTAPLIDQSQTYGSHPSINAYLREYDDNGLETGRLVTGSGGTGLATWADVKANALKIGIVLTDAMIGNAPELMTDALGNLIRDADGNAQLTGNLTNQAFLIDMAGGPGAASLDAHYITGDGRANENIGLTAVHHVFHEEHNYQVENIKTEILATGDLDYIHQWQVDTGGGNWQWNGQKLFLAARLITESEYNHIAIDQYVGTLYGALPEFVSYSSDINMGVSLEFSQAVFRLGHSMLTETINVTNPNTGENVKLLEMFLNPELYAEIGPTALAEGLANTLGNEVDEFVTPALQQSLLGQPLDLAAINIARGRDVGLPTWNELRQNIYNGQLQYTNNTNGGALAPYTSWADVGDHLRNDGTLTNLIAAYARGGDYFGNLIATTRAKYEAGTATIQELRQAAQDVRDAYTDALNAHHDDAMAFMEGLPTYNSNTHTWEFAGGNQGFWDIDLWIGGLAERPLFDGPLGTTFSYVLLDFAQRMQDGDRFYYLYRTPMGTHLGDEIIRNQFSDLVARATGLEHLNGDIFIKADGSFVLDDGNNYFNAATHIITDVYGDPMPASNGHIIIGGEGGDDYLVAGLGDDTVYGDDGDDIIQGSQGNDHLYGGAGDDIISDDENDDFIDGGDGNDQIFAGPGVIDTVFGGEGDDQLHGGDGIDELIGGNGDDLIYGDGDTDVLFGGAGNDYLEGGDSVDEVSGDVGNDWLRGGVGDDHLVGGAGNDLFEGGIGPAANDGDRLIGDGGLDFGVAPPDTGIDIASYEDVDIAITANLDTRNANGTGALLDTYVGIDGLVGSRFNDDLTGGDSNSETVNGVDNLLVGGGGNDTLTGLGGNDILVGDSVATRSDFTIESSFTSKIANWKGTGDDRPVYGAELGHFLGEVGSAGVDTAVFRGNLSDYTFAVISYGGYDAIRVTDTRDVATDGFDGTDILIGIEKARFAGGTVISLTPPVLDLDAPFIGNVADDFNPNGYTGNDGTLNWAGNWSESNDGFGGSASGDITVSSNKLGFGSGTDGGEAIARAVNLSGLGSGTLSFIYQTVALDAGEGVAVEAWNGASWVGLGTLVGNISTTFSSALSGNLLNADFQIRFRALNNGFETGESVSIDNVNIAMTSAGSPGNNYVTSFIEDGAAAEIAAIAAITTDSTTLQSARVVLTNAKAGDILNANAIAGDGITVSTDTSVAGRITINLTGSASLQAYLNQIQAITFSSSSQNPDTADRLIEVTVNNGIFDSNIATATAHVTAVDDPVDAVNDQIVTNFGTGVAFVIPEWALTANDIDPDNAIDVTAVGLVSGLTVSLAINPGSATVTDTGAAGGSFAYTATAGLTSDIAQVAVSQVAGNISVNAGRQIIVGNGGSNTFSSGSGNDIILAGDGNDRLDGGSGADILQGGSGDDDFIFDDGDSGVGSANRDVILDFLGGGGAEDIDLSAIDAIAGGGDNIFSSAILSMATNFTGNGQLRYQQVDTDGNGSLESTLILGNVTGGAGGASAADFEILLKDYTGPIVVGDFIL